MKFVILALALLIASLGRTSLANEIHTIKTYMSFGYPVDPSNVRTLVDLDLSYALASTLVDWTDSRSLTHGLADPIENGSDKEISFRLRPDAKWSDGTSVTASQVVTSFERAKKVHGQDLKSLFEVIEKIEAKDNATVIFHLNRSVASSHILHKLTEPMYGILFVLPDGTLDLSKSSGGYVLKSLSTEELSLVPNPYWYGRDKNMADLIVLRQPKPIKPGNDQDGFSGDPWPNLVASSSLIPESMAKLYERKHFSVWNRSLDRVFFLSPSPKLANESGRRFFQALNRKLDRTKLLSGLSGYHLSQQFFPPGYPIFDPDFKESAQATTILPEYREKPLELLAAEGRIGSVLKQNLADAIKSLTGHVPRFKIVPLSEFDKARADTHYDILVGSLPVNDPNIEGAVSFFFGMTPPLIPNSSEGSGDFRKRTNEARNTVESKRNAEYRRVFTQAVQDGCLLPLFHFSSVVIARDGIDLSRVPTSDETVAFNKVRFK